MNEMPLNEETVTQKKTRVWFILPLILSGFSLCVMIVAVFFGLRFLHQHDERMMDLNQQNQLLSRQSAETQVTVQEMQASFTKQLSALQATRPEQSIQNMSWTLGEVQYWIHLASFTLSFDHNPQEAIDLLTAANHRLSQINDPTLMPLRQSVMNDLTVLKAIPPVDVSDVLLQLNALATQIRTLPVISTPNAVTSPPQTTHHHHHEAGWKRGLAQSWAELKQIIVVQYHNQPVGQLIIPQQRDYLDLQLEMLLSQAQWAGLHQDNVLYQASLGNAIEWTRNNYVESAPQTQALLSALSELKSKNIAPSLPKITQTLTLINAAIQASTQSSEGALL
jgi:uroporphyrin-III C-methyltransferase